MEEFKNVNAMLLGFCGLQQDTFNYDRKSKVDIFSLNLPIMCHRYGLSPVPGADPEAGHISFCNAACRFPSQSHRLDKYFPCGSTGGKEIPVQNISMRWSRLAGVV